MKVSIQSSAKEQVPVKGRDIPVGVFVASITPDAPLALFVRGYQGILVLRGDSQDTRIPGMVGSVVDGWSGEAVLPAFYNYSRVRSLSAVIE